jgi:hypothetical protein
MDVHLGNMQVSLNAIGVQLQQYRAFCVPPSSHVMSVLMLIKSTFRSRVHIATAVANNSNQDFASNFERLFSISKYVAI